MGQVQVAAGQVGNSPVLGEQVVEVRAGIRGQTAVPVAAWSWRLMSTCAPGLDWGDL